MTSNEELVGAVASIARALNRIPSGGLNGPDGLELVAMALAQGDEPSVSASIRLLADAVGDLAEAVREVRV